MEAENDRQSQLGLLSITPEVRVIILQLSIDSDRYHILKDGMISCAASLSHGWCSGLQECHGHADSWRAGCQYCVRTATPALLMTCQLLRREAFRLIRERRSVLCGSPTTMLRFLMHQPVASHLYGLVYLACGPAKHGSGETNQATVRTLQILATCHIDELHLEFVPYYGIHDDSVILRRPLLKALSRFRRLRHFTLRMTPYPPGPLSMHTSVQVGGEIVNRKVLTTQRALSLLVCAKLLPYESQEPSGHLRNLRTALCSQGRLCCD